ncbi:MAG: ABC transporter ATP-binding protein, partial [Clostridia bacterium]|nr:ABC transporter ATP-binding protein [Clostridia bacterium]
MSRENGKAGNNMGGGPMGRGPGMMHGGMVPGAKAKDFRGSITKLLGYLGKHKLTIIFVCILAIVSTVFTILGPKILGQATDELFAGVMGKIAGTGSVDFDKVGGILLWLVGLYVVGAIFSYLQGFVMSSVPATVTFKLR